MQKKKKSTKQMGPKPQYTRKEPKGPRIIAAKYNTSCGGYCGNSLHRGL